jgi:hypothetical protein
MMFESSLLFNIGVFLILVTVLQIVLKALTLAWQNRGLPPVSSELIWGWWIKLHTDQPNCTYYFGPFSSTTQAENAKLGYVQDLETEGAQGITVKVKWCKPKQLTISSDESLEMYLSPSM